MKDFFSEGLFDPIDQRYFRLINRAPDLKDEIKWDELGEYSPFDTFAEIFNGKNVGKESYFDKMTHLTTLMQQPPRALTIMETVRTTII